MGLGLAALSGSALSAGRERGGAARWRDPLFVLAALLVGAAIFGAALYLLASSIEHGGRLGPLDARVDNWLIFALGVLLLTLAARAAWVSFFHSVDGPPWERGSFDRVIRLVGFVYAIAVVALLGLLVDAILVVTALKLSFGLEAAIVVPTVLGGLALAWLGLCSISGNPSPRLAMVSRRSQAKLLSALRDAEGEWVSVTLRATGVDDPSLALATNAWQTSRGLYWRSEDGWAITRYHEWAANSVALPTPALHEQRVTVFAGPRPERMRGVRVVATTRRLWLLDAWRAHRRESVHAADKASRERAAGLVYIPAEQLLQAGIEVILNRGVRTGVGAKLGRRAATG